MDALPSLLEERQPWTDDMEDPDTHTFNDVETRLLMASTKHSSRTLAIDEVPRSYKQAMIRPALWYPPMQSEFATLIEKGVWELVPRRVGVNVMKSMWVYALKYDGEGNIIKYKARFVGKGYSQIEGVDFDEMFGGVSRIESF